MQNITNINQIYKEAFELISNSERENLKKLISENREIFESNFTANEELLHPIFFAIDCHDRKTIKMMLELIPRASIIKFKGLSPIFYAIKGETLWSLDAIIEANPEVLKQKNELNETAIFYAISWGKECAVRIIIADNPEVLNQKNQFSDTPLSASAVLIDEEKEKEGTSYNFFSCLRAKHTTLIERSKTQKIIFQSIAKKQFKEDFKIEETDNIVNFFRSLSLLKVFYYSDGHAFFEGDATRRLFSSILPEIKNQSPPSDIDDFTTKEEFDLYKNLVEIYKKINKNNSWIIPCKKDGKLNNLHIYTSTFSNHYSTVAFHVDDNNKITAISYCDGNKNFDERQKIAGSEKIMFGVKIPETEEYVYGAVTYQLRNVQKFSAEFAKQFVKDTFANKTAREFYAKIQQKQAFPLLSIDYDKATYSIPTQYQSRQNCSFKNRNVQACFMLEQQFGEKIFEFDVENSKVIGKGAQVYQKIKHQMAEIVVQKVIDSAKILDKNIRDKLNISDVFSNIFERISGKKIDSKILIPDELIKKMKEIFGLEKVPTVVEVRSSLGYVQDRGAGVFGGVR